jgi:hypothetical protein
MNRTGFWLSLFLVASLCRADVIKIPADNSTIQDGLFQAGSGDTVMLADGIYSGTGNQEITFYGRTVYLVSENGPTAAIIDGRGTNRAFSFAYGNANQVTIEGNRGTKRFRRVSAG